jgi:hypothetical protein
MENGYVQASRGEGRLSTQHLHRGMPFHLVCQELGAPRSNGSRSAFVPNQETFLYQAVYIYLLKVTDIRPVDSSLFDRRDVLAIYTVPCVSHFTFQRYP